LIHHLDLPQVEILHLVGKHFKMLIKNNQLSELLTKMVESTDRSLLSLVTLYKLKKQISKEELCELENKSWDINQDHKAVVAAKYYIMKEMTQKGKHAISEEYLKKCLL
jgi:hypothetical protein